MAKPPAPAHSTNPAAPATGDHGGHEAAALPQPQEGGSYRYDPASNTLTRTWPPASPESSSADPAADAEPNDQTE